MASQVPKVLPTIIFFSFLLVNLVASQMMSTCVTNYTETINNQTGLLDDKFQVNLQSLLNSLTSATASSLSFYNTTAGDSPHKSYGLYLCRGDATSELCHSCVTNLTEWVTSFDANCTESVAYADLCMFHYANYSFFGRASDNSLGYVVGKFSRTNYEEFNRTLEGVIEQVITSAAYNSTTLFATAEADVGEQEKVYTLAQCTPDIGRGGCSGCLKAAQSYLRHNQTGIAKSLWALLSSCQLRYDNASFFGASSNQAPPSVPALLMAMLGFFFVNSLL